MADGDDLDDRPRSSLAPAEKATRAASFGEVASQYERYRPGPPLAAVEWFLPIRVTRVIDLGAGTGALTRLLEARADDVVAVEPDERMREVLSEQVRGVTTVDGRGDAMPVPDGCADAVLASSSWHWMDVVPTLREVARVLVPGGLLGAVWSGPDPDGPFFAQARAILAGADGGEVGNLIERESARPQVRLEIPPGTGFAAPEHEVFTWDIPLNADELVGLLGTLSWVILMPADRRARITSEARRLLAELLGVEGDATVDVAFRADAYRTRRTGA